MFMLKVKRGKKKLSLRALLSLSLEIDENDICDSMVFKVSVYKK